MLDNKDIKSIGNSYFLPNLAMTFIRNESTRGTHPSKVIMARGGNDACVTSMEAGGKSTLITRGLA